MCSTRGYADVRLEGLGRPAAPVLGPEPEMPAFPTGHPRSRGRCHVCGRNCTPKAAGRVSVCGLCV